MSIESRTNHSENLNSVYSINSSILLLNAPQVAKQFLSGKCKVENGMVVPIKD